MAPRLTGTQDSGFLFEPSAPFLGHWKAQPKLLPTLEALCSVHLPPTPQHIRSTFNEIRQGVPGISTALLAQRLEALERSGVLLRVAKLQGVVQLMS